MDIYLPPPSQEEKQDLNAPSKIESSLESKKEIINDVFDQRITEVKISLEKHEKRKNLQVRLEKAFVQLKETQEKLKETQEKLLAEMRLNQENNEYLEEDKYKIEMQEQAIKNTINSIEDIKKKINNTISSIAYTEKIIENLNKARMGLIEKEKRYFQNKPDFEDILYELTKKIIINTKNPIEEAAQNHIEEAAQNHIEEAAQNPLDNNTYSFQEEPTDTHEFPIKNTAFEEKNRQF